MQKDIARNKGGKRLSFFNEEQNKDVNEWEKL